MITRIGYCPWFGFLCTIANGAEYAAFSTTHVIGLSVSARAP
jgi:hypothetical protein